MIKRLILGGIPSINDCMVPMEWQPEGKGKVERPKTTWVRTEEQEGCASWAEAKTALIESESSSVMRLLALRELTNTTLITYFQHLIANTNKPKLPSIQVYRPRHKTCA